jgi:hypothetical protein
MKTILSLVTIVGVFVSPAPPSSAPPAPATPSPARPATPMAPAKTAPVAAKPKPSSVRPICYGWKPGYSYTYRVKANTQRSDSEEDLDGTVTYTVKSIGSDGVAQVTSIESFARSRKSHDAFTSASTAQGDHASSSEHHSSTEESVTVSSAPARIAIDRYGRITGAEGGSNLPFPVGRMSHLAIEPLSLVDENAWTVSGDVGIVLPDEAPTPASPRADSAEEPWPAREKTTYTVTRADGKSISVRKTYALATISEGEGEPRLAVMGEGELTFDRQNGVFTSSTIQVRVTLYEDGSPLELASLVNCVLVRVAEEPSKDQ